MCKWYVETIFLVKLEAEQNMVFQNYVLAIQQIVESRIRTKMQNRIRYVSIGAGPYPTQHPLQGTIVISVFDPAPACNEAFLCNKALCKS
jgi:hypothetical protein